MTSIYEHRTETCTEAELSEVLGIFNSKGYYIESGSKPNEAKLYELKLRKIKERIFCTPNEVEGIVTTLRSMNYIVSSKTEKGNDRVLLRVRPATLNEETEIQGEHQPLEQNESHNKFKKIANTIRTKLFSK
ncbi:hypothetical protein [Criblamydia sequanensis]|uniref:Uncharacterized protein n=1 Tax=Candidatus Criblamydia sequanensis CRIB-18 TaxID=1437425 RepID=A0A090CYP0_9BACT|nr:hypothetical protein [Criblamydia sequanensis]CDR33641.1 hypothetical protein CSEC_0812 [Criblamydia sequanensis CRIB-18]